MCRWLNNNSYRESLLLRLALGTDGKQELLKRASMVHTHLRHHHCYLLLVETDHSLVRPTARRRDCPLLLLKVVVKPFSSLFSKESSTNLKAWNYSFYIFFSAIFFNNNVLKSLACVGRGGHRIGRKSMQMKVSQKFKDKVVFWPKTVCELAALFFLFSWTPATSLPICRTTPFSLLVYTLVGSNL